MKIANVFNIIDGHYTKNNKYRLLLLENLCVMSR